MTTLYYSPAACSLSPHIALREAGLPFTLERVDLAAKTLNGGADFNRVNGKGYVPVLQFDDGDTLTEGVVIVQHIADQQPGSSLAPKAGTRERARLQEWLSFLATEVHKGFGPFFNAQAGDDWKRFAANKLANRLDWISDQLGDKSYLMGEHFTVADGYLFTLLNWTTFDFVPLNLDNWPMLADYYERIKARPKVLEALQAEGLLS
jgi:glutathione S-transferase